MFNSSLAIILTSYDGKDTILLSVVSSLIKQGYNPVVLNGLSKKFLRSTAYILKYALRQFPQDSIFIVLNHITTSTVVAHYEQKTILVPNNGLITMASEHIDSFSVFNQSLPALLQSKPLREIVNTIEDGHIIEAFLPEPVVDNNSGQITATIIHFDSFGNVITNINNLERFSIFSTLAPKYLSFVKRNVILYSIEFMDVYPSYPFNESPGKQVVFRDEMGYLACGLVGENLAEILSLNEYVQIKISLKQDQTKQATPFLSILEKAK